MRIDMGNFGQAQRQVVSTEINRGNPAEMAEAKIGAARTTERLQGMANQAWDRLGGQMQQIGGQMQQQIRQLAQQKSGLVIQQKQIFAQGILQQANDKVDSGELKSTDVHKFITDSMAEFKYDDIDGLDEGGRLQLDKGLTAVDMTVKGNADHLYRSAHKVETRATTEEMIANNERLALNSGADLDKAASLYDSPVFQAQAREAYGAEFGKRIIQAKSDIYAAGAKQAVLNARDSYSALDAISKEFNEGGRFHGKLDADTQLAITGQIESRKGTLEAKAAAAAARQAAQAQAAAAKQMAAENRAQAAQLNMREFIASGNVPDDATLEKYAQQTAGTSLAQDGKQMAALAVQTQQFKAQPLQAQDAMLQQMAAQMKNGTNYADVKVYNAMKAANAAQKKALSDDPITTVATAAGVEVPRLPMEVIQNARDPQAIKAANQQFSEVIYQRAALNGQARQQLPGAPKVLLTAQERTDLKAQADALPAGQKPEFYKTLANAGGKFGIDLVKEISGSDTIAAASYHYAANPHSKTSMQIFQGAKLIDDPKSGFKPPENKKVQEQLNAVLGGVLSPAQRAKVVNAVNAHYVQTQAEAGLSSADMDDDAYQESIRQVVGDVIQYGDSKLIVPAGTDAGQFRESLYRTVTQTPGGANSMALIESGQARLTAIGAKTYMLTTPGGGPYFDPQTKQPIKYQVE